MKNKKITFFLIAFACCFVAKSYSFSGDSKNKQAEQDLLKVRTAYDNTANLSMDVLYKLYSNHTSKSILEEHKGFYCKQGKLNLYMELYGTLTIQNKDYLFVKDDSSKVFLLAKNNAPASATPSSVDFEKLLSVCQSVVEIPAVDNVKGYKLLFGNSDLLQMSSIEIYFDQTTFLTKKVVLFYNSNLEVNPENGQRKYIKPRLEVNYLNINTAPTFKKEQFDFSKYLKKNATAWQIQKSYSDFELLDQTELK